MKNNSINVMRDSTKELLITDLKYFSDSFWKNEQAGENRLSLFLGLITAIIVSLAALFTSDQGVASEPVFQRGVSALALLSLLIIGVITYFRIIKRNIVSDQFKNAMDQIRSIFKTYDEINLKTYEPFVKSNGKLPLRKFGGLVHTLAAINSLIFCTMIGILVYPYGIILVYIFSISAFLLSFILFWFHTSRTEANIKEILKSSC